MLNVTNVVSFRISLKHKDMIPRSVAVYMPLHLVCSGISFFHEPVAGVAKVLAWNHRGQFVCFHVLLAMALISHAAVMVRAGKHRRKYKY